MKKIIATMVMLVVLMASNTAVFADSTAEIKSIDTVISDIRAELDLKETDSINPEKVSNDLLEQLGDSVMEARIGNHDLHEQMDARMGGDGSAALTFMHTRMGYNYLYRLVDGSNPGYGAAVNGNWNNRMGYTGWGMMNGFAGNNRMGNQYWNSNVVQQNAPSGAPSQAPTDGAVRQSWGSQTPCWNNNGMMN